MFVTLYETGEEHFFFFFGTNAFHVKAKNERFTAASSRCLRNLKYENFTSSFGRLRQKLHRTCSTIIFPHLTNQIINLWRCRGRCRRHFLNSLLSNICRNVFVLCRVTVEKSEQKDRTVGFITISRY